eukprot:158361-Pyramimonas_sp.AAC.1
MIVDPTQHLWGGDSSCQSGSHLPLVEETWEYLVGTSVIDLTGERPGGKRIRRIRTKKVPMRT